MAAATTRKTSLKVLKEVLKLVEAYKLDSIEFNGIKLSKSRHMFATPVEAKPTVADPDFSHLPMTVEDIDKLNQPMLKGLI